MLGHVIQELIYGDPHSVPENPELEAAAVSVVLTFQVGAITSVLGLLRLGFLDVVLSRALLRGFITAVGVVSCTASLELTIRSFLWSRRSLC